MPEQIDLEQYFDQFASASALAEASSFPTVSTGAYRLQVMKYDGKQFEWDTRPFAHLTVAVQDDSGTRKMATVFTDVTWLEGRGNDGKLDRGFKLWNQLTRALYPEMTAEERSQKDVGTVLNDAKSYPVSGFVTEKFQVEMEGKKRWVTAKTTDEAASYRSQGARVGNFVANFAPLR